MKTIIESDTSVKSIEEATGSVKKHLNSILITTGSKEFYIEVLSGCDLKQMAFECMKTRILESEEQPRRNSRWVEEAFEIFIDSL